MTKTEHRLGRAEVAKVIAKIDAEIAEWRPTEDIVGTTEFTVLSTLREAREAIKNLSRPAPPAEECLDDRALQATGIRTDTYEDEDGAKGMRLALYRGAESNILAWTIFPVDELYTHAMKLLEKYDKLEGIE